jgi:hypothetical protein
MEDLIKQAFKHVEVTGPHVQEGHYDLIGPDGEIILPVVWEKTVQPGFQISMRMWPMDKHPLPGPRFPDGMTPEQRMHWIDQRRRMAAAQAQGGHGGHHGGHGRAQPMRPPPGFAGMPPIGGQPPPRPGMMFPPPGGEGMRPGMGPAMVDVVDVKPRKDKGKKAKKTLGFFSGASSKPKKSGSKKFVYIDPFTYPPN